MLSEEDAEAVQDMVTAIRHINNFVSGFDFESYQKDAKTRSAVERQIEIVSEAARRLQPETFDLLLRDDGPSIRAIGNVLRHEYQRVSDRVIWDTVQGDLPELLVRLQLDQNN